MMWRSDRDEFYVLLHNGRTYIYAVSMVTNLPDNPITDTPPSDRYLPTSGFV